MFKNRAIQVQMVKKSTDGSNATAQSTSLDLDDLSKVIKDQIQNVAIAVGGVLVANKVLNTVSEITVIVAQKKIR